MGPPPKGVLTPSPRDAISFEMLIISEFLHIGGWWSLVNLPNQILYMKISLIRSI